SDWFSLFNWRDRNGHPVGRLGPGRRGDQNGAEREYEDCCRPRKPDFEAARPRQENRSRESPKVGDQSPKVGDHLNDDLLDRTTRAEIASLRAAGLRHPRVGLGNRANYWSGVHEKDRV